VVSDQVSFARLHTAEGRQKSNSRLIYLVQLSCFLVNVFLAHNEYAVLYFVGYDWTNLDIKIALVRTLKSLTVYQNAEVCN